MTVLPTGHQTDERIDHIMGTLLRTGVILAASIVFIGGILYLTRHRVPVTNYHVFQGQPAQLRHISGIVHEAAAFRGLGLIQLGLLLLIATPISRVIFSVFAFAFEKDWKYVLFTLIVLATLFYSLLGPHG